MNHIPPFKLQKRRKSIVQIEPLIRERKPHHRLGYTRLKYSPFFLFLIQQSINQPTCFVMRNSEPKQKVLDRKLAFRVTDEPICYHVACAMENNGRTNTTKYGVHVHCSQLLADNTFYFRIDKTSKTFINDMAPTNLADELATQVGSVLDRIVLKVTRTGEILSIENFNAIAGRWSDLRKKIREQYASDYVARLIQLADRSLASKETLLLRLSKNWFMSVYFNALYQNHNQSFMLIRPVSFPILSRASPVYFEVKQTLEEHYTENNAIRLILKGQPKDARSKADLENDLNEPYYGLDEALPPAEGSYRGLYALDPVHHGIHLAYVECALDLSRKRKVTVMVTSQNETPYELPTRKRKSPMEIEDITSKGR
ncbi:MAG TPA: hypothetical protein VIU12_28840 [Chryseolinea sp.]